MQCTSMCPLQKFINCHHFANLAETSVNYNQREDKIRTLWKRVKYTFFTNSQMVKVGRVIAWCNMVK